MATYSLPHFGIIDTSNLDEYYDVSIDFMGEEVSIDLNFDDATIDANRMEIVKKFIEKLADFDLVNKKYIEQDYVDEAADTVRTYIQHHLVEIPKEELAGVVDFQNNSSSPEKQLLISLHLVRLGLYPHGEGHFATFDYSIGRELTQYLVVINLDENGELDYMTMES